ncbi:DUF4270 family protein [Pedobacter sp. SYSU D00535]|uniref:DUF4270 family protein n=1 Tax=Pedobacter sp. SYSU D00535 TaxID=2810308 RepID=UPI001A969F74|nr:DUF4270 family protein [Pedobacter sp. SYSU D00535]
MKYLRQDLLTLLISLFIFSSCQKSDTVGLDLDPDNAIISDLTDTATVWTSTVREDTVATSSLAQSPLGYFNDPVLGITRSDLALDLSVPSDNFSFGTNPTLDSAVLVLRYGDEFYGDSLNTTYNIKVHQLTEGFVSGTTYYNNKIWGYNSGAVIGGKTVNRFAWNDSLRIRQIIKGAPDTLRKIEPHLRIPIDNNFATNTLLNANSANFVNTAALKSYLKGLYLTAQVNGTGGIIFLNPYNTTVSRLEVYYKNTNSNNTRDTLMASFGISTAAASISHDYPAAIQNKLGVVSQEVYVQPMGGLRTKVKFPYLEKIREKGNFAINKAELVVSVVDGTTQFRPARRLVMYRTDIAGQRQMLPDYGASVVGVGHNANTKRYIFNVSNYVQQVLNGSLKQYDLFIAAIDPSAAENIANFRFGDAATAQRSVLGGTAHPNYKIKLNIYYTKPE